MLDDIKSASQSVKEKFINKILLHKNIGKKPILPEIDISTNATVNITEQTIALKENKIKELDQQILLGSEIDSILETQQLQAMADPSNVRLTTKHESLPFLIHSTYFYYFYSVYIYHSRS